MKKLHFVMIGLMLAGAVALVGCSRYDTAHEGSRGYGKGRAAEQTEQRLGQSGRSGGSGRGQAERQDGFGGDQADRQGGLGRGQSDRAAGFGRGNSDSPRNFNYLERQNRGAERFGRNQSQNSGGYEQSGRIVAAEGTVRNLSGLLESEAEEWYLSTDSERYILHFGNKAYVDSTGIDLQEGKDIEIRGFVSGEEIAVATAKLGTAVYEFRHEDGTPMWAGSGRGENQVARAGGSGAGRGNSEGTGVGRGNGQGTGQGRGRSGAQGSCDEPQAQGNGLNRQGAGAGNGNGQGKQDGSGRAGNGSGGGYGRDGFGNADEPLNEEARRWWYQQPFGKGNPQAEI